MSETRLMAGHPLHTVLDHLRRLHRAADAAQCSDRELLRAFATNNDQDAFAVVVTRHAPLVWGVCRRILGHQQDAEDAFQATFLILARRAGSVRWQTSVGGWLHTVAQRLAVRARKQTEQRRMQEREASRTPPGDASLRELAAVVDEELRRLPAKYREPLLLHYLEGATAQAAARQLGLSRSAFYNRLTRGRELLRERLSRQGLSLAAPLVAAALTAEAEAASRSLIEATLCVVVGSVPERVAVRAAESLGVMAMMKLRIVLAVGLVLGVAAGASISPCVKKPRRNWINSAIWPRRRCQALANKPSLEMRQRVQALLERLRGPVTQPELLQALRAVAVLEDIGTPEARRLLQELTKGAANSRLTREATASLRRLDRSAGTRRGARGSRSPSGRG